MNKNKPVERKHGHMISMKHMAEKKTFYFVR